MRFAALFAARATSAASRLLRRGSGTTLPGVVAERLHPTLLATLSRELEGTCVAVTGTNGKTTTAKMLGDITERAGHQVVRNDSGSNLRGGILSALVASAKLTGGVRGNAAVIEVDEAASVTVLPSMTPDVLVVTNFSRDQLDRYGDLDTLTRIVGGTLAGLPGTTVLLNADDPMTVRLAKHAAGPVRFFGIESLADATPMASTHTAPAPCPECSSPVRFARGSGGRSYDWECPACGARRPALDFAARDISLSQTGSSFTFGSAVGELAVNVPVAGLHTIYNALAASAAASLTGTPEEAIVEALGSFEPAFGRTETMDVDGNTVVLLLAKNPAGVQQALATALAGSDGGALALVLNDNAADGTDVSWIWDVEFEGLPFGDRPVVVGGSRAEDLAVRLKYAGIPTTAELLENDPAEAARAVARLTPPHRTSYVVATYTAMLAIRNAFARSSDKFSHLGVRIGSHAR